MPENIENMSIRVEDLLKSQPEQWEAARAGYRDLENVMLRTIRLDNGSRINVQFNPARILSSNARVDKKSVSRRPCFLCSENRPAQQVGIDFENRYTILVNPFPIFKKHLTIPLRQHLPQLIGERFGDMLLLSRMLGNFMVFYNGPRCGASAPDHFHFQAGNKGFMPVEEEFLLFPRKLLSIRENCTIEAVQGYFRHTLVLAGDSISILCLFFDKIYHILHEITETDNEPMMNILAAYHDHSWRVFIFPRRAHRPHQFFAGGDDRVLISPASVDMGGVWITPRKDDYEKLDAGTIRDIFDQVTIGNEEWQYLNNILCSPK